MSEEVKNCHSYLAVLFLSVAVLYFVSTKFPYYFKFVCGYFFVWAFSFIALFGALLRPFDPSNIRYFFTFGKFLIWFSGIQTNVLGSHNIKDSGPYVVVANHQSSIDSVVIGNALSVINCKLMAISKYSLLWIFPYGTYLWLCNWAFIKKGGSKETMAQLDDIAVKLKKVEGILIVFPEGTRNKSEELLPFKKGAFHIAVKHKINVVPIVLSPFSFIDDNKKIYNSGNITVKILEPISTEGVEDISEFAESVRQVMTKEYKTMAAEINSNNST